jgi:hypothetical protein
VGQRGVDGAPETAEACPAGRVGGERCASGCRATPIPAGLEKLPYAWPPTIPLTPPLPEGYKRPGCCDLGAVSSRLERVVDQLTQMTKGEQPAGGVAGSDLMTSFCDKVTGVCIPWMWKPETFHPDVPDRDPCVWYCGVLHEWVHHTDLLLREAICLRSFLKE